MKRAIDDRNLWLHRVLQLQRSSGRAAWWRVEDRRSCRLRKRERPLRLAADQRHLPPERRKRSFVGEAVERCVLVPTEVSQSPTLAQVRTDGGENKE